MIDEFVISKRTNVSDGRAQLFGESVFEINEMARTQKRFRNGFVHSKNED